MYFSIREWPHFCVPPHLFCVYLYVCLFHLTCTILDTDKYNVHKRMNTFFSQLDSLVFLSDFKSNLLENKPTLKDVRVIQNIPTWGQTAETSPAPSRPSVNKGAEKKQTLFTAVQGSCAAAAHTPIFISASTSLMKQALIEH